MDAVVSVSGHGVNGISFDIEDASSLRRRARKLAVRDAVSRARTYADAAGVGVGKILTISEQRIGGEGGGDGGIDNGLAFEADVGTRIEGGEVEVLATVYMVFEVEM